MIQLQKAGRIAKILFALVCLIGVLPALVSVTLLEAEHDPILAAVAYVSAYLGTGLLYGFKSFKDRPKWIGNFDEDLPYISQTWAVFFISLIFNLTASTLCR